MGDSQAVLFLRERVFLQLFLLIAGFAGSWSGPAHALPYDIAPCNAVNACDEGKAYMETVKGLEANANCSWIRNTVLVAKRVERFDAFRWTYSYDCFDVVYNYLHAGVGGGLTWFHDGGTCSTRTPLTASTEQIQIGSACHVGCEYKLSGGMLQPTGAVCAVVETVEPNKNNCCEAGDGTTTSD